MALNAAIKSALKDGKVDSEEAETIGEGGKSGYR